MVSLCLIQILYLITNWLFKNVFLGKIFSPTSPNWVWKTSDFFVSAGNDTCTQGARNPVVANSNEF